MSSSNGATRTRTVKVKPLSAKQRGEKAALLLRETLDLPAIEGDATVFGAALAEAASEESARNMRFADAIRERYRELLAQQPAPKPKGGASIGALPPLVPIRRIEGYRADPFSAPDPQFLIQLYGYTQLARALQDYTPAMLKETAAKVQQDHPDTKPSSKTAKQALIDYIVKYSDA